MDSSNFTSHSHEFAAYSLEEVDDIHSIIADYPLSEMSVDLILDNPLFELDDEEALDLDDTNDMRSSILEYDCEVEHTLGGPATQELSLMGMDDTYTSVKRWPHDSLNRAEITLLIGDFVLFNPLRISDYPSGDLMTYLSFSLSTLGFQQYGSVGRCPYSLVMEWRVFVVDWNWFDSMFDITCVAGQSYDSEIGWPLLIVFEYARYYSPINMVSCINKGLLDSDGDNMKFFYITHSTTCVLLWDPGIDSRDT